MKPVLIAYISFSGFHLSGVVWSYPPNDASGATLGGGSASGGAGTAGNGYQQGGGALVPSPSVVARLLVADRDNGNAGGQGGSSTSGNAAFPIEENKCYKVSVSFDR